MKFISLVMLSALLSAGVSRKSTLLPDSEENSLQAAFSNITNALAQQNHLVSVIVKGKPNDKKNFASFYSTARFPHVIKRLENGENFTLNSSAIVSLESVESLNDFNKHAILSKIFSMKQQLFIHCRDGSCLKVRGNRVDQPIIQYEYFLVEETENIQLITFQWYMPPVCGNGLFIVNSFDKKAGRWAHHLFKIDKFSNFNGCRIRFLMDETVPDFIERKIDYEEKTVSKCEGVNCVIVKDFSSTLNYTYEMDVWNRFNESRLWPEIPYDVMIETGHLLYPLFAMDPQIRPVITRPYNFIEHFFTVPPGEKFNGYEKMILPFDEDTWMWIGITFGSAFVTIFVLRFVSKDIANFIIGKGIGTPGLNVLRAFFGVSQIVCPARNFARYLLMMFIIFSLIIRTAYQAKMFEFLQKEIRKPKATTIDEMIDQNFTFYMLRDFITEFPDMGLIRNNGSRNNFIDNYTKPEFAAAFKRCYVPGSKTSCYYMPEITYQFAYQLANRNDPPLLLKDRFILEQRVLEFKPQHFMFDVLDRKLQQYIEAGFVNYNSRFWSETDNPKMYEVLKEPFAVLTLLELEAGFVVCLVPFVLSIFVFAFEWMPTFKDLILVLFIFKKYFEVAELEQSKCSQLMKTKFAALQAAKRKKGREDAERDKVYNLSCL